MKLRFTIYDLRAWVLLALLLSTINSPLSTSAAQLQRGWNFGSTPPSNTVTAAKLHALVDSATVLPGIITSQPVSTNSALSTNDLFFVVHAGDTNLYQIYAWQIFSTNYAGAGLGGGLGVPYYLRVDSNSIQLVNGALTVNATNFTTNFIAAITNGGTNTLPAYTLNVVSNKLVAGGTNGQGYSVTVGSGLTLAGGTLSAVTTTNGAVAAWCKFVGTNSNGANFPTAGLNVSNVVRTGAGSYTLIFTNAFATTNYCCTALISAAAASPTWLVQVTTQSVASVSLLVVNGNSSAAGDPPYAYFTTVQ